MLRNSRVYLWGVLAASSILIGCDSSSEKKRVNPSIYSVISDPEKYSEVPIWVSGILHAPGNETSWRLYPTRIQAEHNDTSSSIALGSIKLKAECDMKYAHLAGTAAPFVGLYLEMETLDTVSAEIEGFECIEQ
jgi:hypothetical protein